MAAIRDIDIREALHKGELKGFHDDENSKVIEELGIMWGSNRADIAVVNGKLWCYEIKSEADSFYRLEQQLEAYNRVFDKISLVIHDKHLDKFKKLRLPKHIGTYIVSGKRGQLSIQERRKPAFNHKVDAYSLAHLLWREESVEILQAKGIRGVSSLKRQLLCSKLAEELPLEDLKTEVRSSLKTRQGWRAAP